MQTRDFGPDIFVPDSTYTDQDRKALRQNPEGRTERQRAEWAGERNIEVGSSIELDDPDSLDWMDFM